METQSEIQQEKYKFPDKSGAITLPPFIYGGGFLIGMLIHFVFPVAILRQPIAVAFGVFLIVISIPIVVFSMRALIRARTAIDVRKPTTTIVATGPYQFSRNPIYLAMTILYVGISLIINSVALLAMLIPIFFIMNWGVISREERYLEQKFGEEYKNYKNRVQRWL